MSDMALFPKLFIFIVWMVRWLKPLLVWTSSKSLLMAGFLLKYVRVILTFYFILGFIPDAFMRLLKGNVIDNLPLFIFNVATPFVTAEHKLIEKIAEIESGTLDFGGHFWAYVDIMAALVIFVYVLKFLCWAFAGLASNSSLRGIAPLAFSVALLAVSEFAVLGMMAVSDADGDLTAAFTRDATPMLGLFTLAWNIPTLLRPFAGLFGGSDEPIGLTYNESVAEAVDAVTNSTGEMNVGVLTGIYRLFCDGEGLC